MALVSQTMEAQACHFEIIFILTFAAMRTGKDLILVTKEFTSEVKWKSWFYLLSTLLIVFALFAGTLSPIHLSLRLVLSILTGLVLVRLFVIYHDYGQTPLMQAEELKNWLMALAVDGARIRLLNHTKPSEPMKIGILP